MATLTLKDLQDLAAKAKIAPQDLRIALCQDGDLGNMSTVDDAQIIVNMGDESVNEMVLHYE